tara:strand:+ start:2074 stop:2268 length:195 start_codon:yes stop_codon:yes gene_type:complete
MKLAICIKNLKLPKKSASNLAFMGISLDKANPTSNRYLAFIDWQSTTSVDGLKKNGRKRVQRRS